MEVFFMKKWIIACAAILVTGCSQQNVLIPVSGVIEHSLATTIVDATGKGIGTAELTET
jgi:Cu-Zn family superoxide dismutase